LVDDLEVVGDCCMLEAVEDAESHW
jgi:hypothetical protein